MQTRSAEPQPAYTGG